MKGERAETTAIGDVVKRIAIAFPAVRFTLSGADRTTIDLPATDDSPEGRLRRIAQVMGAEFPENSISLDAAREQVAACRSRLDPLLHAGQFAAAICLCQRQAGARQADCRRHTRRLHGCPAARPARRDRPVPDPRPGAGRRQRTPREGRRALPRPGSRARTDRRRHQTGAGRRRHPHGHDRSCRDDERLPAGGHRVTAILVRPTDIEASTLRTGPRARLSSIRPAPRSDRWTPGSARKSRRSLRRHHSPAPMRGREAASSTRRSLARNWVPRARRCMRTTSFRRHRIR